MDTIDLSGPWRIRPDPRDEGMAARWWERPPADGWLETTIPSAWQLALGADYRGVAWYQRLVHLPRGWGDEGARLWLRFEAVATDCRVWVNGREAGRHIGDWLPFQFEITQAVRGPGAVGEGGRVEIVCRVDMLAASRPPPGVLTQGGHLTKGFHDVLSLQHGGIWDRVALRRTGLVAIVPGGAFVRFDEGAGEAIIGVECEDGPTDRALLTTTVEDPDGRIVYSGRAAIPVQRSPAERSLVVKANIPRLRRWSPDDPALYTVRVQVEVDGRASDAAAVRYGFRTIATGGPDNRTLLLNGRPLLLRGVLHWGHEPRTIAPAPRPEQVREEFGRLRALGLNGVCLCMWYPPEPYYRIADETGMLLWQEHPVWKSPMQDEHRPEYQRLFEGFFRRDRAHASVVVVSGSCEHECFSPALAEWWWRRARERLPDKLLQVQTAFLAWTNPHQTDLHDEHIYESSGRWVAYLEDLQDALAELPPKPFVMGETIIGTAWPDVPALRSLRAAAVAETPDALELRPASPQLGEPESPWWMARGLDACAAFESDIAARYGRATLERFRRQAEAQHLAIRKFQSEVLRTYPNHAAWVMNHLRDVPTGRCGFKDDLERWRYTPDQTLPWLADRVLLLWTPEHRRGFVAGRRIDGRIGVSNFAGASFDGPVAIRLDGRTLGEHRLSAAPGQVASAPLAIEVPVAESPVRVVLEAAAADTPPNRWTLWAFPPVPEAPPDVVRLDGLPYSARELEPEFEERSYSSGWGLKAQRWRPQRPDLSRLMFKAPLWRFDAPLPRGTRAVLAHRLTARLVEFVEHGGRAVLLASAAAGGPRTVYTVMWGQCPLIVERGPLAPGDSEWIADLLHLDLTYHAVRAVPVDELGIADQVDPLVRLIHTHDAGTPRPLDALFQARVGRGLLIVSTLDHAGAPGQHLLGRLLAHAASDDAAAAAALDPAVVRSWAVESARR